MTDYSKHIQKIRDRQKKREAEAEHLYNCKDEVLEPISEFALALESAECITKTQFADSGYGDLVVSMTIAKENEVLVILVTAEKEDKLWNLVVDTQGFGGASERFQRGDEKIYDFISDLIAEHG